MLLATLAVTLGTKLLWWGFATGHVNHRYFSFLGVNLTAMGVWLAERTPCSCKDGSGLVLLSFPAAGCVF